MRILLIISGSIAAYKSLELIRRLRERGASVRCILTQGGAQFVTPLSVAALSEQPVYSDVFSLKDETEMGHIRLSREADLVLVAPASANLLASMAAGRADDLASTVLLATDKPVWAAPAMNAKMWEHAATQRNIAQLAADGVRILMPDAGMMACGEVGPGRMMEVAEIVSAIEAHFAVPGPLCGKHAVVTSGPTFEAIDPVRFLGNRASGKQGHAIAEALAAAGARVTLVTGPVALAAPEHVNITTVQVESAAQMLTAVTGALPADIAVFAAAVADWQPVKSEAHKLKKRANASPPTLELTETVDILRTLSQHTTKRPALVVGFAAETENLLEHAREKRARKGCDWVVANSVAGGAVFGADETEQTLITGAGETTWGRLSKSAAAAELTRAIAQHFTTRPNASSFTKE